MGRELPDSLADRPQRDDEVFDVVDEQDRVVRQATRLEVHTNNLLHRAVHIWVFGSDARLLLQMRSARKDQYPSTWTSSASGHVDAGESYHVAAKRELAEELGLTSAIEEVITLPASAQTAFEFTSLWIACTDDPPRPSPVEIESLRWWSIEDAIEASLAEPTQFSPPLRELLRWWLVNRVERQ